MQRRLYTAEDFAHLEEALVAEAGATGRGSPAGIDILAGSNVLCRYLGRILARRLGGLLDMRLLTFPGLVAAIEERTGAPPDELLPEHGARILVDEILAQGIPPGFEDLAAAEGFGDALCATFDDLSEGGCGVEQASQILAAAASRGLSARVRGVLELFARFRERIDGCGGDIHSRYRRAADRAGGALRGRRLFVYGFYDFNELQRRLVVSAAAAAETVMFIPCGQGEEFRFAAPLVSWSTREGFERRHDSRRSAALPAIDVFSAPDPAEQGREIARLLVEQVEGGGAPVGAAGILPWSEGDWPVIREALDEAGIPWHSLIETPAAAARATRGALHLLRLLTGGLGRSELVDFLVSAPLGAPSPAASGVDPFALWVRSAAAEGLTGEQGWRLGNERLVARARRAAAAETIAGRQVEALREATAVIEVIEQAQRRMAACTTWSGCAGVLRAAVEALMPGSEGTAGLRERIGLFDAFDRISPRTDPRRFAAAAEALIGASGPRGGGFGAGGVNVFTVHQARGLRFAVTFLPGLTEGAVPGHVRQDPFLKDAEREALERIGGGIRLSRRAGRLEESELMFALACRSAVRRIVCSFPRLETATGKEYVASAFLAHPVLLSRAEDGVPPVVRRLPLGGRVEGSEVPLGPADYDFIHAGRPRGRGRYVPPPRFFRRGASLVRGRRNTARLTPYDGVFESSAALDALQDLMRERRWSFSATFLEAWARCPFAFLMERILGVVSAEEPERKVTLTPLQRGAATHLVLESLYRAFSAAGLLPLSAPRLDAAFAAADEVCASVLDEFAEREPVGRAIFWEAERRRIGEAVRRLVFREAAEGDDRVPSFFEERFGADEAHAPVRVEANGRTVFLGGRIDRIDRGPGGRFRVVDYKTGKLRAKDQDFGGGTNLQLPVYLLAASGILRVPVEGGEAVYLRVGSGDGRRLVRFSGSNWSEDSLRFGRILETIVGGISGGLFFASPCAGACGFCEVRQACPAEAFRLCEDKAARDARCRDYLAMREADDAD